jgi:hypothetical protein
MAALLHGMTVQFYLAVLSSFMVLATTTSSGVQAPLGATSSSGLAWMARLRAFFALRPWPTGHSGLCALCDDSGLAHRWHRGSQGLVLRTRQLWWHYV